MALVLQFLSTKIFQRTLSLLAQENQLHHLQESFPFCECKGTTFPETTKETGKIF